MPAERLVLRLAHRSQLYPTSKDTCSQGQLRDQLLQDEALHACCVVHLRTGPAMLLGGAELLIIHESVLPAGTCAMTYSASSCCTSSGEVLALALQPWVLPVPALVSAEAAGAAGICTESASIPIAGLPVHTPAK